jgi:hydrogenase maturation protein HypF
MILSALTPEQLTPGQGLRLTVQGMVQGVGFRPFVYRLAQALGLTGGVQNTDQGVVIELEGELTSLRQFLDRFPQELPPHAAIHELKIIPYPAQGYTRFTIRESTSQASTKTALILPDLATCPACLREIFDPGDRRYRYPFTNCIHCGPRFSIIEQLPYDRPHTTMRQFQMCPDCQAEYDNPGNSSENGTGEQHRRFHAQPNACAVCGPGVEVWSRGVECGVRSLEREEWQGVSGEEALKLAEDAIRGGKVLAVKGLGGFHLVVDARNDQAVQTLRQRKQRPHKPFAVMYPNLKQVQADCEVSEVEAELLRSPAAPIVLLKSKIQNPKSKIAPDVAPGNPYLGVMLPYTPLHHLLLADLGFPIVATSGNLSGEPICIDNQEAVERLGEIADLFLVHHRPIARPVDDSMVRVIVGKPMLLRRARGYAPMPVGQKSEHSTRSTGSAHANHSANRTILAVGAHLKNTVALHVQGQTLVSQHLGDLDNVQTAERFQEAIAHLQGIYDAKLDAIACDAHPDYQSTHFAQSLGTTLEIPVIPVQHHQAHILACMAEHGLQATPQAPVLGFAWDGTGYGLDNTIWGGETLLVTEREITRIAHLRPFPLPGGDQAVREPRRSALGLLYALWGETVFDRTDFSDFPLRQTFSSKELKILRTMLQRDLNTVTTSSIGRLFDAIAALLNLCPIATYEGQAAMQLEFALDPSISEAYPLPISPTHQTHQTQLDWHPLLFELLQDQQQGVPIGVMSAKFHNALVNGIVAIAQDHQNHFTEPLPIVLAGGCFQNQYLLETAIHRLRTEGFTPYWPQQLPPNDGAIAVGQIQAIRRTVVT